MKAFYVNRFVDPSLGVLGFVGGVYRPLTDVDIEKWYRKACCSQGSRKIAILVLIAVIRYTSAIIEAGRCLDTYLLSLYSFVIIYQLTYFV